MAPARSGWRVRTGEEWRVRDEGEDEGYGEGWGMRGRIKRCGIELGMQHANSE